MTQTAPLPYPAELASPSCPDIVVPPALALELLRHLRGTAHLHVCTGAKVSADVLTLLADDLDGAVNRTLRRHCPVAAMPQTEAEEFERALVQG